MAVLKVKWLVWEIFYFYNLFSQSATLPVYVLVSLLANLHFFFYLTTFQRYKFLQV